MALVELSFPARPAHVRTARQVAVSLARRGGLTEDLLDEIRLAVAEACGLTLSVLQRTRQEGPVAVDFDDSDGFAVEIRAGASLPSATGTTALDVLAEAAAGGDTEELPAGAALAVLAEVAPVLEATTSREGLRLRLAWPPVPD